MSDTWYGPIIDNIEADIIGSAYGAILSGIGLGDDSSGQTQAALQQIQGTLGVIEAQIAALDQDIKDAEKQIILAVEWNTLVANLLNIVETIESDYTDLVGLSPGDKKTANSLLDAATRKTTGGISACLATLQAAVVGNSSPGSSSLLQLWTAGNLDNATANRGPAAACPLALVAASQSISTYFHYLVGLQFKALILLINAQAPLASDSDAQRQAKIKNIQSYLTSWTSNPQTDNNTQGAGLSAQAEMYRSCMETLTVNYFYDQSLLGFFSGPYFRRCPIFVADQNVSRHFPDDLFAVRVWGGQGSGFNTGTFNTSGQGAPLTLLSTTQSPLTPDYPNGFYAAFSPPNPNNSSQSSQWSMYRYTFRNLPAGIYQISPAVPNMPFYNCWPNWKSFPHYDMRTTPSFAVNAEFPGSSFFVALTGVAT